MDNYDRVIKFGVDVGQVLYLKKIEKILKITRLSRACTRFFEKVILKMRFGDLKKRLFWPL